MIRADFSAYGVRCWERGTQMGRFTAGPPAAVFRARSTWRQDYSAEGLNRSTSDSLVLTLN